MADSSRGVSPFASRDLPASFAERWQAGETPLVEEVLANVVDREKQSLLRELLQVELRYRRQRGDRPTPEDYLRRFPDAPTIVGEVFAQDASTADSTLDQLARTVAPGDDTATLAPHAENPLPAAADSRIGDYELQHEIARGGMGVVYKARQTSLNRSVALKMILSGQLASEDDIKRFRMEAGAAAQLDHPGIVPIYEIGEHQGQPYFSMGLVEGESLAARIADGPLAPHEAAKLVSSIAAAVDYAHQRGVIHRDLKPGNVLIDQHNTPKVTDFGLAKRVDADSNLTGTGDILGTPSYMPPEQAGGELEKIGPASDIYSLGAILYCLLTARPPFQAARPLDTVLQVIAQDPVPPTQLNPTVDKDLETICLKCLEKPLERRYTSAAALKADLDRFLNNEPIHARRISSAAKLWRWCRRKPLVASLVAAVVISVIFGVGFTTYFAMEARLRAQQAEETTTIAISTLETMVNDVQERLRPIPAAQEVRRELLRSSLAELQRVSADFRAQRRVDRNTAKALLDLANLFDELGDEEGLDATKSAESNYRAAADIYRELNESEPSDQDVLQEYSITLTELGTFYLDVGNTQKAEHPLFEALEKGRDATAELPHETRYWLDFGWILANCGDWYAMRSKFREAQPYFDEAIQIARRMMAIHPGDRIYEERLAAYLEKAGDAYHDMRQNDAALERFQKTLELRQKLYEQIPESPIILDSLSFTYERLGNHWLQVGKPGQALAMYRKMLEFNEHAVEADPANRPLRRGQAVCYEKISKAARRVGNLELANSANKKAREIRQRMMRKVN